MEYVSKAISSSKPFWGTVAAVITYILPPDSAYQTAAIAVGIAMLFDIITIYMTLSHEAQGFKNACKT